MSKIYRDLLTKAGWLGPCDTCPRFKAQEADTGQRFTGLLPGLHSISAGLLYVVQTCWVQYYLASALLFWSH